MRHKSLQGYGKAVVAVMPTFIRSAVVVSALVLTACKSCNGSDTTKPPAPAGRRELELVDKALGGGGAYAQAMAELEKTPTASLRAVREQSAPPRSREAMFLAMMADHLARVDRYREWKATMEAPSTAPLPDELKKIRIGKLTGQPAGTPPSSILGPAYPNAGRLDRSEHVYFWAEQLLAVGGDTAQVAAVSQLARLGTPTALDALALYVRQPATLALGEAAAALGQRGRGRDLAEALAAYRSGWEVSVVRGSSVVVMDALRSQPAPARAASENEILTALETEPLTADQRAGYVAALGAFASERAADRLVRLRDTDWGKQMRREVDAAIAEISNRDDSDGSGKP